MIVASCRASRTDAAAVDELGALGDCYELGAGRLVLSGNITLMAWPAHGANDRRGQCDDVDRGVRQLLRRAICGRGGRPGRQLQPARGAWWGAACGAVLVRWTPAVLWGFARNPRCLRLLAAGAAAPLARRDADRGCRASRGTRDPARCRRPSRNGLPRCATRSSRRVHPVRARPFRPVGVPSWSRVPPQR